MKSATSRRSKSRCAKFAIAKGLFSAEDHRKFTEFAEHIGPTPAARMVAKAWLDPGVQEAGA
jgi:hypothetical protein